MYKPIRILPGNVSRDIRIRL